MKSYLGNLKWQSVQTSHKRQHRDAAWLRGQAWGTIQVTLQVSAVGATAGKGFCCGSETSNTHTAKPQSLLKYLYNLSNPSENEKIILEEPI